MWKIIIKNKSKSGKGGIKIKNKQENNKINNFFSGIFSKKI